MHTSLKSPCTLIFTVSLIMIAVTTVQGDYQIGWVLRDYSASPNNYLATDGVCCRDDCSPCAPVLRFCFRESGHPRDDTETCTLGTFLRNTVSVHVQNSIDSPRKRGLFTGSFQVYVRVAHDGSVPPMYDPCHPIIDNVFFEFTGVVASDPSFTIEQQTGDFGRATIDLAVNVICAEGYNGTDCNTFCEEINGVLTCREDDVPTAPSIVNPTSSGTICTTGDPPATSGPITDLTSPSIQATSGQETDNNIDLTSTLSQGTGDSMTVALTGGLAERGSDNTLAIALGVGIGGAVLLCLLVGLIILLLCLVCRVRRKKQKTAFYTVRRTEEPSSVNGGDKYARRNGDDSNTQENGHSTNPEDLYTTVNKKSNAPPLPPPYTPDDHEYQNLSSQQGHQGVVFANASTSREQDPEESVYLRYAVPSTSTAHVNQHPHTSNGEKSIYLRFADPTSHVNEDASDSDSSYD